MGSIQLLDKTRKINKLLHNNNSHKVVFNDICSVMSDILDSNVLVISSKGKVLGISLREQIGIITELVCDKVGSIVDGIFNERILNILSTKENVNLETLGFTEKYSRQYQAVITPIDIAGERLGTMFIYKTDNRYDIDDIILCEYGATVVGLEMMRAVNDETNEGARKLEVVRAAFTTLSSTEFEAIRQIFKVINRRDECTLVASRIADSAGITRSVLVTALKKLESAGLITATSSGMRGTYIRVLNEMVYEELDKMSGI